MKPAPARVKTDNLDFATGEQLNPLVREEPPSINGRVNGLDDICQDHCQWFGPARILIEQHTTTSHKAIARDDRGRALPREAVIT